MGKAQNNWVKRTSRKCVLPRKQNLQNTRCIARLASMCGCLKNRTCLLQYSTQVRTGACVWERSAGRENTPTPDPRLPSPLTNPSGPGRVRTVKTLISKYTFTHVHKQSSESLPEAAIDNEEDGNEEGGHLAGVDEGVRPVETIKINK